MTKEKVQQLIAECGDTVSIHYGWSYVTVPKNTINFTETHVDGRGLHVAYSDIKAIGNGELKSIGTSVMFGSDPELFFVKNGQVVPSNDVITSEGGIVTRDGFQLELNPHSHYCREVAGSNIATALEQAKEHADRIGAELSIAVGVTIGDEAWKKSSFETRRFGCNPTSNVYQKINRLATGMRIRFRSGAGHIHIGNLNDAEKEDAETIVKLMDIVGGNTAVLVDRDENNAQRRKYYGRAGEYRLKPYGVEYRVYSNFWLRHYVLWSMAAGLLRNAVGIYRAGLADDLLKRFDMKKVREAINTNNKQMAMENFLIYRKFLIDNAIFTGSGLDIGNVDNFLTWASKEDPIAELAPNMAATYDSWEDKRHYGADGFERFLNRHAPDEDDVSEMLDLNEEDYEDDDY